MMDLTESIFLHSGEYTSFTVFVDYPCHVRYVKSVAVPPGEDSVDFYAIDPAPYSRWVVVQRRQGERRSISEQAMPFPKSRRTSYQDV